MIPPSSICFFNNKGGVGKTTLACNVGAYLAEHHNLRVLLVDADPQCNATQLILDEATTEELYPVGTATKSLPYDTLRDVLSPLNAGEATISGDIRIVPPNKNRFGIAVLPGHPKVALLEDHLSTSWSGFSGGYFGGGRVTNWNTQLTAHLRKNYDLVIYDVGPSLGALNRSVLIGVDFFLSPMGCDIFSLIGITNIAEWLHEWRENYAAALTLCEKRSAEEAQKYSEDIARDAHSRSRFIGYTVQQYITKTIRKKRRATSAYETILNDIPARISETLASSKPKGVDDLHLGDVPHMYSLVPLAQAAHAPIHALLAKDGLKGGAYGQQQEFLKFIRPLAAALYKNLELATVQND